MKQFDALLSKTTEYILGVRSKLVGIENRDRNTNVRFNQKHTLERIFNRLEASGIGISRALMDYGSCSEEMAETLSPILSS